MILAIFIMFENINETTFIELVGEMIQKIRAMSTYDYLRFFAFLEKLEK